MNRLRGERIRTEPDGDTVSKGPGCQRADVSSKNEGCKRGSRRVSKIEQRKYQMGWRKGAMGEAPESRGSKTNKSSQKRMCTGESLDD